MAEIVLFHHACGLTEGVLAFAQVLREAGHTVQTPDLFGGRTFADVHRRRRLRANRWARRPSLRGRPRSSRTCPADLVYGGMSMGAARAAEQVLARPGARGAFFLYGAIAPSWWEATWPAGVPSQAHVTEGDKWREPDAEAAVPGRGTRCGAVRLSRVGPSVRRAGPPGLRRGGRTSGDQRVLAFLASL